MNPELQKARQHYHTLPPHVKDRATAKHLLTAIQIAEQALEALRLLHDYQNGCPLDKYAKEWNHAMQLAQSALGCVSNVHAARQADGQKDCALRAVGLLQRGVSNGSKGVDGPESEAASGQFLSGRRR